MTAYAFILFAVIAVLGAAVAVAHRKPVVSVLSLVVSFFGLAAVYAIVGMDFLAAVQLVVYAGAVLVLFLFVVMLLGISRAEALGAGRPGQAVLGTVLAVIMGILLMTLVPAALARSLVGVLPYAMESGTAPAIGEALMGRYLFQFELVSVVLLAALVGAFVLARRER